MAAAASAVSLAAPSNLPLRVTVRSESLAAPSHSPRMSRNWVYRSWPSDTCAQRTPGGGAAPPGSVKMTAGRCRHTRDIVQRPKSDRTSCFGFHAGFGFRISRPGRPRVLMSRCGQNRPAAYRGSSESQVSVAGPNRISLLGHAREARWETPGVAAGAARPPPRGDLGSG